MPRPGPRYPARNRRGDVLRGQVLGVSVRRAEQDKPVQPLRLTPTRRGFLEAVEAGQVKWYPTSAQWRSGGQARSLLVRECSQAGWVVEHIDGDRRRIELTDEGRKAIGSDDAA